MVFRLQFSDFRPELDKTSNKPGKGAPLPRVTLNDLTAEEWSIVNMTRDGPGTHGCLLPETSPLARQCRKPDLKPRKDAFNYRRVDSSGG